MSQSGYLPRHVISLGSTVSLARPKELPEMVRLDSPALEVMTDFHLIRPVTVKPDVLIDDALEGMRRAGVRLLLVTDEHEQVIGLISAADIQGDKPIRIMEENRVERAALSVAMVMTPRHEIKVLDMRSVVDSQVGHIVQTLADLERQHILVVEVLPEDGHQQIRGLFSTSQISKQLGHQLGTELHAAQSLVEMVLEVGTSSRMQ